MSGIRILVCGGRGFSPSDAWNWLEGHARSAIANRFGRMRPIEIDAIIHGGAHGADEGAARWGDSEHCKVIAFPADWRKHGKAAGPIRNRKMAIEGKPDVVIAFPGGRGTANMIETAEGLGIPVIRTEAW